MYDSLDDFETLYYKSVKLSVLALTQSYGPYLIDTDAFVYVLKAVVFQQHSRTTETWIGGLQ